MITNIDRMCDNKSTR